MAEALLLSELKADSGISVVGHAQKIKLGVMPLKPREPALALFRGSLTSPGMPRERSRECCFAVSQVKRRFWLLTPLWIPVAVWTEGVQRPLEQAVPLVLQPGHGGWWVASFLSVLLALPWRPFWRP